MAAYYPERPSEVHKANAKSFMFLLGKVYVMVDLSKYALFCLIIICLSAYNHQAHLFLIYAFF